MLSSTGRLSSSTLPVLSLILFLISQFLSHVRALGSTDTITWGGDNSRSGYQNNHNLDPAVVGSSQFGQLFKTKLPGNYNGVVEQVYSQPLVYTTLQDGIQYVYLATTQNNVYKLDAKTGAILASRNLHIPFSQGDLGSCVDINPLIGITATGVIDPTTDTLYLTSKTYLNQSVAGAQGRPNGRYYLHAINVNDLTERPNFPVNWEGVAARNNPIRTFNGGIQHQRPGLLNTGQYIYAGFASHCIQYNYTGWIFGWDKTTGAMVENMTMEGLGIPNTIPGAGVWMSGGGLASDNAGSMFFATGNGNSGQLAGIPVLGRQPPTALEEAAVHAKINSDGSLSIVDFFMPFEKQQLDGADRDLGTSPLEILPSQFSCGNIKRIGVVTGKSGKTYWINLDDMGGYQNGPNKLDDVIQVYQNENSVYAGAGVYPLEGGYIYINVIQYPTHVFQFSCTNGVPSFSKVADSPESNAYILGVGHGTVTSLNDQPGTGLVWVSDVEGYNLRIYNAVPVNGTLNRINQFNIAGVTKFTRPVFGNGRVYIGTTQGYFYGFGAPVNQPLSCGSPYSFGTANLGTTTNSSTITCVANIATNITGIALSGNSNFKLSGIPALPVKLAAGASITFQAVFNPLQVGLLSSDVAINTINAVTGYSIYTAVSLTGYGQSSDGILGVAPNTLAFQGVITGQQFGGVNQTAIWSNIGNGNVNITQILFSVVSETGPFISPNVTSDGKGYQVGPFTFINVPSIIPGNTAISVIINFNSPKSGNFAVYTNIVSSGGTRIFDVVGTSGDQPLALLQFQTPDGLGWVNYSSSTPFTFGDVTQNTLSYLNMRLTNIGGPNAASLSLTVSKPPFVSGLISASNTIDLAEGTILGPGQSANATLYCAPPKSQINVPTYNGTQTWLMNANDPTFGQQSIQFFCNAVSPQIPYTIANGSALYPYIGCFQDNNPSRILSNQIYANDSSTIEMCIAACYQAGYIFAGTEYRRECWCGNTLKVASSAEGNCNFACAGNYNENCGGSGLSTSAGAYLSLFADRTRFGGTIVVPPGPVVNPGVLGFGSIGCYTDSTGGRALSVNIGQNGNTSVLNCIKSCSAYLYAGVEYGSECYCGNVINASGVQATLTDCNFPCNGNSSELCGAGSRMNLYMKGGSAASSTTVLSTTLSSTSTSVTSSSSSTSLTSSSSSTTLTGSSTSTSGTGSSTSTSVTGSSSSTTSTGSSSSTTSTGSSTSTSATSSSTSTTVTSSILSTSTGSSTSTTLTGTSTSTSSSASATTSAPYSVIGAYSFLGCYTDSTASRTLKVSYAYDAMTLESCAANCTTGSYTYFGTEYGRECWCGNVINLPSTRATNQADCSFNCAGNAAEKCGAGSRMNLYQLTNLPSAPKQPSAVQYAGNFTYIGCWTDVPGNRTLTSQTYTSTTNMTIENCAAYCVAYKYFATEYAQECYCGNVLQYNAPIATDNGCTMTCTGQQYELCGGPARLQMYQAGLPLPPTTSSTVTSTTKTSTSSSSTSTSTSVSTTSTSSSSSTSTVTSTTSSSTASSTSTPVTSTAGTTTSATTTSTTTTSDSSSSSTSTLTTTTATSSDSSTSTSTTTTSDSTTSSTSTSATSSSSSSSTSTSTTTSASSDSSTSTLTTTTSATSTSATTTSSTSTAATTTSATSTSTTTTSDSSTSTLTTTTSTSSASSSTSSTSTDSSSTGSTSSTSVTSSTSSTSSSTTSIDSSSSQTDDPESSTSTDSNSPTSTTSTSSSTSSSTTSIDSSSSQTDDSESSTSTDSNSPTSTTSTSSSTSTDTSSTSSSSSTVSSSTSTSSSSTTSTSVSTSTSTDSSTTSPSSSTTSTSTSTDTSTTTSASSTTSTSTTSSSSSTTTTSTSTSSSTSTSTSTESSTSSSSTSTTSTSASTSTDPATTSTSTSTSSSTTSSNSSSSTSTTSSSSSTSSLTTTSTSTSTSTSSSSSSSSLSTTSTSTSTSIAGSSTTSTSTSTSTSSSSSSSSLSTTSTTASTSTSTSSSSTTTSSTSTSTSTTSSSTSSSTTSSTSTSTSTTSSSTSSSTTSSTSTSTSTTSSSTSTSTTSSTSTSTSTSSSSTSTSATSSTSTTTSSSSSSTSSSTSTSSTSSSTTSSSLTTTTSTSTSSSSSSSSLPTTTTTSTSSSSSTSTSTTSSTSHTTTSTTSSSTSSTSSTTSSTSTSSTSTTTSSTSTSSTSTTTSSTSTSSASTSTSSSSSTSTTSSTSTSKTTTTSTSTSTTSSSTSTSSTSTSTSTSTSSSTSTTTSTSSTKTTTTSSTTTTSTSTSSSSSTSSTSTSSTSTSTSTSTSKSTTSSTTTSSSSTSSSSSSTTKSTTTSTSTSAQATYTGPPVIVRGNANFTYFGCISDLPAPNRVIPLNSQSPTSMTVELCLAGCNQFKYAGLEYSRECYCGNTLASGYANLTDASCNYPCLGNTTELCGGSRRLSLYVHK